MNEVVFKDGSTYYRRDTNKDRNSFESILRANGLMLVAFRKKDDFFNMEASFRKINDINNRKIDISYVQKYYKREEVAISFRDTIFKKLDEENEKIRLMAENIALEERNKKLTRQLREVDTELENYEKQLEEVEQRIDDKYKKQLEEVDAEIEKLKSEKDFLMGELTPEELKAFLDSLTPEELEALNGF